MTVQDLIDALQLIEDKSLNVVLNVSGVYNSGIDNGYGVVKSIEVVSRIERQDYSNKVPVVFLCLDANNELDEAEIVMMRDRTIAPFASMWETSGVCAVLDKNDQVIKRYFLMNSSNYCELAAAERDRLNAEWRKEHK